MLRHAVPAYLILAAQSLRNEDDALLRLEEELALRGKGTPVTKEQLEAVVSATRSALCHTADVLLLLSVVLQPALKGDDTRV